MSDLIAYATRVTITDGATGTQLAARGLPPGAPPELWNAQNPDAVADVARAYAQAGAQIVLTNTFGANSFVLGAHGLGERAAELAEKGAALARKGAAGAARVFGSIGPTGKIVMMQEVPEEDIELAFAQTATGLAHGGAEAIVLETFNELDELELALQAVRRVCSLPVVACMTFGSGPDRSSTMMGNTPGDLARVAVEGGASAVGANCGLGPDGYVRVAGLLKAACALPLWIKANAGLPQVDASGKTTFPMGPRAFAASAKALREAGANFIGGCCGTTPEHIAALRGCLE